MQEFYVINDCCLQHAGTGSAAAQAVLSDYIVYLLEAKNAAADSLSGVVMRPHPLAPPASVPTQLLCHSMAAVPATAGQLCMPLCGHGMKARIASRQEACSASMHGGQ